MRRAIAIGRREFRAYFLSPTGYIVLALFLAITGPIFFWGGLLNGSMATMRSVFGIGTWLLAFIAPAITMRLLSEEFRLGTFESLMTSPVRERHVVVGKFLGAIGFLAVLLAPTSVYVVALEMFGRPDYGELLCGYLGLVLAGTAYLASGLMASAMTSSQPVAFLMSLFFWIGLGIGTKLLPEHLDDRWARVVFALDPDLRLRDFTIGLVDTANVVYFLSFTVVFLVGAVGVLHARRWR